jgi:preprotein translocase subunit YajC
MVLSEVRGMQANRHRPDGPGRRRPDQHNSRGGYMLFDSIAHAMGSASQGGEAGNPLVGLMPLILMFVIFYFLLIRPQQKKAKQHRDMLAGIKKGDKVLTSGGIYGRVLEVDADVLTVDIGHDMKIEVNRNFVSSLADRAPKDSGKK